MISALSLFLLSISGICAQTLTEIKSCGDLSDAVDRVNQEDVTVSMYPFADIECMNHTTFNITSGNKLTIVSTDNLDNFYGYSNFVNVRLNVINGSSVSIENEVIFESATGDFRDLPDVNGGAIYVGENSEVRFLNSFKSEYIGVRSQTEFDSDFPNHQNSGGVIFNAGKFVVEGMATFDHCENSGGGEGSPGPGGCVYNEGKMLFKSGVEMEHVSILDDEGNNGAGFYNLGTIRISGDCKFSHMFAETAGGIYNGKGAKFIFRTGSSVVFDECKASDGFAGIVYNDGFMKFAGAALFLNGRSYYSGGAIVVGKNGVLNLKKDAIFFNNYSGDKTGAPVYVQTGGEIEFNSKKTSFIGNFGNEGEDAECLKIYTESDGKCSE